MALRKYQSSVLVRIHRGMFDQPGGTYTVMLPRQSGKNELAVYFVGGLLVAHQDVGGSVVVCAPTFTPQALISYHRAMDTFRRMVNIAGRFVTERNAIRFGEAVVHYLGANPEANVAGHTASLAIVADEAQDVDVDWFDRQFRPMAAARNAPTVMFGTAWNGQTLLERAVDENRRAGLDHIRNLRMSWETVADEIDTYGDYVRAERQRLGAGHHLFRTQYDLLAGQPRGSLLDADQLAMLEGTHPRLAEPVPGQRYVGGLDIGGAGPRADASVLTIGRIAGRNLEVVEHRAWQGVPLGALAREVASVHRRWRLGALVVDATGMGSGMPWLLEDEGVAVHAFTFNASNKSELGNLLVAAIENRSLRLYADDGSLERMTCLQELRDCEGHWQIGRFTWGNDRGHDDYVASLVLCLQAARIAGPARVARGRPRAS